MIVGMWMARNLVTVGPDTPLREVAALMLANRIRRIPITERHGSATQLLGLVSATDLYRAFPANRNPFSESPDETPHPDGTAGQIMTSQVLTATPETPIEDAATVMRDRKIGALPVLRAGELVGLITESDIFRAFIDILKEPEGATRVTFSVTEGENAFEWLGLETRRRNVQVRSVFSTHTGERCVCVVRFVGPEIDQAVEDLWSSGHQVLNVLRLPAIE